MALQPLAFKALKYKSNFKLYNSVNLTIDSAIIDAPFYPNLLALKLNQIYFSFNGSAVLR